MIGTPMVAALLSSSEAEALWYGGCAMLFAIPVLIWMLKGYFWLASYFRRGGDDE